MDIAGIMMLFSRANADNALSELDGISFVNRNSVDFLFGITSNFHFHSFGEAKYRGTVIDLAESYFLNTKPAPNLLVFDELSKNLDDVSDIRRYLSVHKDLRNEGDAHEDPLAFYLKSYDPKSKIWYPSHTYFTCLVDGKDDGSCGSLEFYSKYDSIENDPNSFVDHFVKSCSLLKPFYAVSGCSLLRSSYSSPTVADSYPLYKRFPGLLYADSIGFSLEINRRDDTIVDVNWLTAISASMMRSIGGIDRVRQQLSADVNIYEYEGGAVFRAGRHPKIGDVNMGDIPRAYKEVNDVLRPLRFEKWTFPFYLRVPENVQKAEATMAWISRFD